MNPEQFDRMLGKEDSLYIYTAIPPKGLLTFEEWDLCEVVFLEAVINKRRLLLTQPFEISEKIVSAPSPEEVERALGLLNKLADSLGAGGEIYAPNHRRVAPAHSLQPLNPHELTKLQELYTNTPTLHHLPNPFDHQP